MLFKKHALNNWAIACVWSPELPGSKLDIIIQNSLAPLMMPDCTMAANPEAMGGYVLDPTYFA